MQSQKTPISTHSCALSGADQRAPITLRAGYGRRGAALLAAFFLLGSWLGLASSHASPVLTLPLGAASALLAWPWWHRLRAQDHLVVSLSHDRLLRVDPGGVVGELGTDNWVSPWLCVLDLRQAESRGRRIVILGARQSRTLYRRLRVLLRHGPG